MKHQSLFAAALLFTLLFATQAFAQTERLGDIKYRPPTGFERNAKDHAVVFSRLDQAKGTFCFITLYAASASDGSPQKDFAREWKTRVVEPWSGAADPKTVTEPDNGWTVIAGGSPIDFNGNKAFAFLSVASGFGKTVSLLGVLNDDSYLAPFQAFAESMDIDKTPMAAPTAANSTSGTVGPIVTDPRRDDFGRLIIPLPVRQLTTADLAGQWGVAASFHQRYVYRDSGNYAGADSLTFKSKMTLTSNGGYYDDFYAIQNGKLIKEKTGGVFAVSGRVLSINEGNPKRYVIRGWLELPDITVIVVHGPYYKDDVISAEIFNNPMQGANLDEQWVRKRQ